MYVQLAATALICLLGGFVQGASGFGSGLVVVGLLPFVMDTKDALVAFPLAAPFFIAVLFWRLRRHVNRKLVLPCIVTAFLVGIPLGVHVFVESGAPVLKVLIGISLILFCSYNLLSRKELRIGGNRLLSSVVGVFSGFLTGATNTGGPPIVLYFYSQHMSKETTSATLQAYFLSAIIYKVCLLIFKGQVQRMHVSWAAWFLGFLLAGILLGLMLFHRIDKDRLRRAVYVMLVIVGVVLVTSGLGISRS